MLPSASHRSLQHTRVAPYTVAQSTQKEARAARASRSPPLETCRISKKSPRQLGSGAVGVLSMRGLVHYVYIYIWAITIERFRDKKIQRDQ